MLSINSIRKIGTVFVLAIYMLPLFSTASGAASAPETPNQQTGISIPRTVIKKPKKTVDVRAADTSIADKIPSLFFTFWQHKAILDAKNSRGMVRAPSQGELNAANSADDYEVDPGDREVVLSGIMFTGDKEWVIWLNNEKVTPNAIPKEVIDLKVFEDYIEVKWLDEYTMQVFPLRLRVNQRFNMDIRSFLPG